MRAQFRSEMAKLTSTRTTAGLALGLAGIVVLAVGLHGYGLPAANLGSSSEQLSFLIGWGAVLANLFAGLAGALSFTAEVRHGTIRPTLMATPRRTRVVLAKALAAGLVGLGLGLLGTTMAAGVGRLALAARGVDATLDAGQYGLFIAGGALAGALWAVVGLGVGAVVRAQIPTVVAMTAWVLFVEGIVVENIPAVGRFAPGALGQALAGLRPDTLLAPLLGATLLSVYAIAALAAGSVASTRRDFA